MHWGIGPIFGGPTAKEIAHELLREERIQKVWGNLRQSDYDLEKIIGYLGTEEGVVSDALIQATEIGDISLCNGRGREIWRSILDFYQKKGLDLFDIQHKLYEITASEQKQTWLNFKADGIAALCKVGTLGIVMANPIIEAIRGSAYKKYFTKLLNPERYMGMLTSTTN